MDIRIGLTASNLKTLNHKQIIVSVVGTVNAQLKHIRAGTWRQAAQGISCGTLSNGDKIQIEAKADQLIITGPDNISGIKPAATWLELKGTSKDSGVIVKVGSHLSSASLHAALLPQLHVFALNSFVRVALVTSLEKYVKGVLQSEMPASYQIEALKAQAVAARTYALNPRISHDKDNCDICDSYLCCQCFQGLNVNLNPKHQQAIDETKNEILTFQDSPILALFSACAGGHTENYENCFSDPITDDFPPKPLSYLQGVPEGALPVSFSAEPEHALHTLFESNHIATYDSWSPKFRWTIKIPADALEAQMHHVIDNLLQDKDSAPFIAKPTSKTFGHIDSFKIRQRGVAGTAMAMDIHTSHGIWTIKKELVIRKAFHNSEIKLDRLRSARIFFEHHKDKLGLLSELVIHGLGFGHGVGLQQVGAQGMAIQGKSYRQILAHYFKGVQLKALT